MGIADIGWFLLPSVTMTTKQQTAQFELQVGERLKTARERMKRRHGAQFTQEAVALRCRVDPKTLRSWEQGTVIPSEVVLRGLAQLYEVTFEWLLTGADQETDAINSFAA